MCISIVIEQWSCLQ